MKILFKLIFFSIVMSAYNMTYAQNNDLPKLLPLIEHNATPGAGCFIQDDDDNVYVQLYADSIFVNLFGKEELFEIDTSINEFKSFIPTILKKGDIRIIIKETEKEKSGCITEMQYEILIEYQGKSYLQTLRGFCGC